MRNKKIYLAIGLVIAVLLIFSAVGIYLYHLLAVNAVCSNKPNVNSTQLFKVEIPEAVESVAWIDTKRIVMSGTEATYLYDVSTRDVTDTYKHEEETVAGVTDQGGILFCSWSNKAINDPEEYATDIRIVKPSDESPQLFQFHETVRVVECTEDKLILSDNYHASPGRHYLFEVGKRGLTEIEYQEVFPFSPVGDEQTSIIDNQGNELFKINKFNTFRFSAVNVERNSVALLDYAGGVWVYISV